MSTARQTLSQPRGRAHLDGKRRLRALEIESRAHPAVNHIWLENVASRRYVDMESTLRGFARDYYAYSSGFPIYLTQLIGKLKHSAHRALLERNLREEQGEIHSDEHSRGACIDRADIEGVPHPELFLRFCRALGIRNSELGVTGGAGQVWRQQMIEFLETASPTAALGALGPGTEAVVRPVYQKLLRGIRGLSGLERRDRVFFDLHCTLDDQHGLDLQEVACDLLHEPNGYRDMRQGMLEALRLRQSFFSRQQTRVGARIIEQFQ